MRPCSTFIPLPKRGDLKQCVNYRTVFFVSKASKILLLIILERIRVKTKTTKQMKHGHFCDIQMWWPSVENVALVRHFQPRVIIFACRTHRVATFSLSQSGTKVWAPGMTSADAGARAYNRTYQSPPCFICMMTAGSYFDLQQFRIRPSTTTNYYFRCM